jgi:hypothetical protein
MPKRYNCDGPGNEEKFSPGPEDERAKLIEDIALKVVAYHKDLAEDYSLEYSEALELRRKIRTHLSF